MEQLLERMCALHAQAGGRAFTAGEQAEFDRLEQEISRVDEAPERFARARENGHVVPYRRERLRAPQGARPVTRTAQQVRCITEFVTDDDVYVPLGARRAADDPLVRKHRDNFLAAKPLPPGYDKVICLTGFATQQVLVPLGSEWHADDPVVIDHQELFAPAHLTERERGSHWLAYQHNRPEARKQREQAKREAEQRRQREQEQRLERAAELEAEAAALREAQR